jgi:recombinational DNA repair protein (RecF pathway)
MINLKLQALVLAREKFKENDALVYILSKKSGVLKCLVKGLFKTSSKNLTLIQPGNLNNFFILTDLNKFQIISALPLRTVKDGFSKNPYIFLWSLKIIKNIGFLEISPQFWFIANHLENYISQHPSNFPYWFLFQVYRELGYELELGKCVSCQRKIKKFAFFDNKKSLFCLYCRKDGYQKIDEKELRQAKKIKNFIRIPSYIPDFLKKMLEANKNLLKNDSVIKFNNK